ncbi:MAG: putative sugar nucleotidyl transferase [bacterium]
MLAKNIIIFEDDLASNFNPLALTRPVYELICGMKSLWENIVHRFYAESEVAFLCRSYLKDTFQQRTESKINDLELTETLLINGRILATFSDLPPLDGDEEIGLQDNEIVYARLNAENISGLSDSISDNPKDFIDKLLSLNVPKKEVKGVKFVKYLWELIGNNAKAIEADFSFYAKPENSEGVIENGSYVRVKDGNKIKTINADETIKLMNEGKIPLYIGKGSTVYPNVTIDLTGGPVYIGAYADIRPPTLIDGPCCIMDSAGTSKKVTIIDGALIRSGSTLGPVCRVGGELEESIIQGYTNKHHAGFIGHAYLGEWVNIGAMATNSDLKNDLSDVKVPVNGQLVDTGDLKVGCFIGDHAKLGIGALLTTGTVVGIITNVLSSGDIPPQYIPSFCFYRENKLSKGFRPKQMIETAARVMSRRAVTQTSADVALLEKVFEMIEDERDEEIEKHNRKVDMEIIKLIKQYEKERK